MYYFSLFINQTRKKSAKLSNNMLKCPILPKFYDINVNFKQYCQSFQ